MKRIVLRKAGNVGSIIFTSIEVLAKQITDEKRAREQAEAVIERLPYAKSLTDLEALLPWTLKQEFEDGAATVKLAA